MLRSVTFLALSLFAVLTSPASAETNRTVSERDGYAFEYTTTLLPNENFVIRGMDLKTREKFKLTVNRKGRVDGKVAGRPVRFTIDQAKRNGIVARLKADPPKAGTLATASR